MTFCLVLVKYILILVLKVPHLVEEDKSQVGRLLMRWTVKQFDSRVQCVVIGKKSPLVKVKGRLSFCLKLNKYAACDVTVAFSVLSQTTVFL